MEKVIITLYKSKKEKEYTIKLIMGIALILSAIVTTPISIVIFRGKNYWIAIPLSLLIGGIITLFQARRLK